MSQNYQIGLKKHDFRVKDTCWKGHNGLSVGFLCLFIFSSFNHIEPKWGFNFVNSIIRKEALNGTCVWMRCSGGVIIRRQHLVTVSQCVVWGTANAGLKYQVTLTWRQTNDNDWESMWSMCLLQQAASSSEHTHSDTDSAPPLLFYTREVFWWDRRCILKAQECFKAKHPANTPSARLHAQIRQLSG